MKCDFCGAETTRGIIGVGAVCDSPFCEARAEQHQRELSHDQFIECPCGYSGWRKGYLPFATCPKCGEFLFATDRV